MEELSILSWYLHWGEWVLMGIALFITVLVWKIFGVSSKNQHISLPPGSTGWPIIGETITFYRAMRSPLHPRQFIDDHEERYWPIFRCNLFGRAKTVVSVDPEFNRYILQNEGRLKPIIPCLLKILLENIACWLSMVKFKGRCMQLLLIC